MRIRVRPRVRVRFRVWVRVRVTATVRVRVRVRVRVKTELLNLTITLTLTLTLTLTANPNPFPNPNPNPNPYPNPNPCPNPNFNPNPNPWKCPRRKDVRRECFRRGQWCQESSCWRTFFSANNSTSSRRSPRGFRRSLPQSAGRSSDVQRSSLEILLAEGRWIRVEPSRFYADPRQKVFR